MGHKPHKENSREQITPVIFTNFKFHGGSVTIPVDAWEIDLATPPYVKEDELPKLEAAGNKLIGQFADYIAEFAKEFQKVDVEHLK